LRSDLSRKFETMSFRVEVLLHACLGKAVERADGTPTKASHSLEGWVKPDTFVIFTEMH